LAGRQRGEQLRGYSGAIVVDAHFVLRVSHGEADLPGVAPLLCAGITTWSPLRHWQAGPGKKVGIVGIGGLGHMGVKLAHPLGAHVVAPNRRRRCRTRMRSVRMRWWSRAYADEMAAHARSFDFMLNTVDPEYGRGRPRSERLHRPLKRDGTMTLVGVPSTPHPSPSMLNLIFGRKAIAGSVIVSRRRRRCSTISARKGGSPRISK
jgi:alcohol dehydrogenase (NADP+)